MIKVLLKDWKQKRKLFLYRKYISEDDRWLADRVDGNSDFTFYNNILEKSYHNYNSFFELKQKNKDFIFVKDRI